MKILQTSLIIAACFLIASCGRKTTVVKAIKNTSEYIMHVRLQVETDEHGFELYPGEVYYYDKEETRDKPSDCYNAFGALSIRAGKKGDIFYAFGNDDNKDEKHEMTEWDNDKNDDDDDDDENEENDDREHEDAFGNDFATCYAKPSFYPGDIDRTQVVQTDCVFESYNKKCGFDLRREKSVACIMLLDLLHDDVVVIDEPAGTDEAVIVKNMQKMRME